MFQFETNIRVTYADTDQMGYVYYGNYARFYEIARTESIRSLGATYKAMEEAGVMMPVLENHSKYIAPARYDEVLTVKVRIDEKPKVKIWFYYDIYNDTNDLINSGSTLLVFVDMKSGRPCRMPEYLDRVLSPYFES